MSLTMAILMLISMWLSIAAAMLWGVLRIVKRHSHPHHPPQQAQRIERHVQRARRHANAH